MAENNWALKLDLADTDRVTLSNNFDIQNLDKFTLELWVKPGAGATVSNQRAFSIRQGSSKRGIRLACVPIEGKLRFEFARADGTSDTNYSYAYDWDDYWHHVAFTVDIGAKQYNMYIDGGLVQTGRIVDGGESGGTALKVTNSSTSGVFVGAWSPDATESNFIYWDGKVDNIRLWSVVRSEADILASKDDHISTSTTGLIDEWRFNEGSGFTSSPAKNVAWTGTHYRLNGTVQTSAQWAIDRPFLGDGVLDVDPPIDNTMSAPTSIGSDGFTLNWASTTDDVYVQYYEVTVATDSVFSSTVSGYSALNAGLVTSLAVSGLSPNTNYYARVRAFDAEGNASSYVTYNSNAAITTSTSADVTPPSAPVATSATDITDTEFVVNWNAATDDLGVIGYKLDIAENSNFTTFVAGFRNLDVGSVLTYNVSSAIDPSKTYYYRVRAYDLGLNESADSNTVTLNTSAPPDTEAPRVVVTQVPTSIGSTTFTARWNVGVDNVAVTGYRLDIATDESFLSFVSGYENLDVGNVTSYGVVFLTPQTGYYYRVRAYDAAGNISTNTDAPESVTTRPSTIEEGGTIEVAHFPTEDTYVSELNPSTNYSGNTALAVDGTPDGKVAYLYFDLNEITGTIVNANLRLYVTDASTGTFEAQLVDGDVDSDLITWATDSSVLTGTPVEFIPSTASAYVEVDIASLLSGPDGYWVAITTTSTDGFVFNSMDANLNQPELVVEVDPTSSTELDTFTLTAENVARTNLIQNPSAEVGGTAFGGATGITALGAATLLQDDTYAFAGDYACKVTTTTAANDGVKFESAAALAIAGTGQTFTGIFYGYSTAVQSVSAKLRLIYTDASITDGVTVILGVTTAWNNESLTAVATSGKTVDKVEVHVFDPSTTAHTFWIDAVAVVQTAEDIIFFDGETHPTDADWDGTANASQSTYEFAQVLVNATYLGDGDEDNSVAVRFKRSSESEWAEYPTLLGAINRSTKEVSTTVGPFYVANYLYNPAFDAALEGLPTWPASWGSAGAGSTLLLLNNQERWDGSEGNVLKLTTTTLSAGKGTGSNTIGIITNVGDEWTFSAYMKGDVGGEQVVLRLTERSSADALLVTHTSETFVLTTEWQRYDMSIVVTNASVAHIWATIVTPTALAQSWYVNATQLERGSIANPYLDGSRDDGLWAGIEYLTETYRVLSHEVEYDVELEFTDPDGVVGANPSSSAVTTLVVPDDPLTAVSLALTPSNNEIMAVASYTGDDNETATAQVRWKRSDISSWSTVGHTWDRNNKQVLAQISNLKPGTDYDVKVTFTDLDDGVYGVNPLQELATTTITGLTAAAKEKISFGGFMLSGDDDHGFLVTEHDAFSHPERLTQVEQLPRSDGAVELSDWWGKRKIKLKGVVTGESRSDLYNRIAELRKALAPRQQRLVIDTLAANNYYFNATCTSLGIMEVGGENFRHVEYDAEFTCADPFRYEASETTESDIELFDEEQVVISNDGDIHLDPTFTITTTSSVGISLTLINETTGERITPEGTIASGDRLIIDSSRLSVLKNGVEIDYAGGFPRLATGQNTITVVLSSGSVALTVRRRHRFL